jgi:protoheme IX farnesyltransferase
MTTIRSLLPLLRLRVSLAVAGGALFGALYCLGRGAGGAARLLPWHSPAMLHGLTAALGAGVLCAACSALNQVQERDMDARMERTRHRPVATGRITARAALFVSLGLMGAGLLLFLLAGGWPLLALGAAVPVIYNGVYTPLKRVTPMALLAGGLSGALPPLIGWVGAGGSLLDPFILAVTTVFYLWQVPHFWLLQERHRDDYRRAGFPTLESHLPGHLYRPLLGLWVGAYFLGLGCLAYACGPAALGWLVPSAVVLAGGWALAAATAGHGRHWAMAVSASLPVVLVLLLGNTL